MKIVEYQSGGIYYTPFFRDSVMGQQTAQPSASTAKSSGDEDAEDNIIKKEIVQVLKENGLQNDVDYFLSKAKSFLSGVRNSISGIFGESKSSFDLSGLLRVQSLANRVKRNKQLYDKAESQIISEFSGSDPAVSRGGYLYVVEKGTTKVEQMRADDYYENQDNYHLLSNADLLRLREDNPELAYNSSILTDLANTVGMKTIIDYVKDVIKDFGTTERKLSQERLTVKQADRIEKGLEQIVNGPDGVYKVGEKQHSKDQGYIDGDPESLNAALSYLYNTLDDNMKHVLVAATAKKGLDPSKSKNIHSLLYAAIIEHTNHSRDIETTIDYEATASKEAGFGATAKNEALAQMTRAEAIITAPVPVDGEGAVKWTLHSSKDKSALQFYAFNAGPAADGDNKPLGECTIMDWVTNDPVGAALDRNSISFGGKLISSTDARRMILDGTSDMYKVYLPYNRAEAANGHYVPDFDAASRFNKFIEWYDKNKGRIPPQAIAPELRKLGLDGLVQEDQTGEWKFKQDCLYPFLLTYAIGNTTHVNINENSKWLSHISKSEGKKLFDRYKNLVNYGTTGKGQKKDKREDVDYEWLTWGEDADFYKSVVAVPISNPMGVTTLTNSPYAPKSNWIDPYYKYYRSNQVGSYQDYINSIFQY